MCIFFQSQKCNLKLCEKKIAGTYDDLSVLFLLDKDDLTSVIHPTVGKYIQQFISEELRYMKQVFGQIF